MTRLTTSFLPLLLLAATTCLLWWSPFVVVEGRRIGEQPQQQEQQQEPPQASRQLAVVVDGTEDPEVFHVGNGTVPLGGPSLSMFYAVDWNVKSLASREVDIRTITSATLHFAWADCGVVSSCVNPNGLPSDAPDAYVIVYLESGYRYPGFGRVVVHETWVTSGQDLSFDVVSHYDLCVESGLSLNIEIKADPQDASPLQSMFFNDDISVGQHIGSIQVVGFTATSQDASSSSLSLQLVVNNPTTEAVSFTAAFSIHTGDAPTAISVGDPSTTPNEEDAPEEPVTKGDAPEEPVTTTEDAPLKKFGGGRRHLQSASSSSMDMIDPALEVNIEPAAAFVFPPLVLGVPQGIYGPGDMVTITAQITATVSGVVVYNVVTLQVAA